MVPEELKGRRGKQADGTAKTRQVYLGCVFTQHRTDEKGHPVRDYESTTYVSSFKSIDDFGPLLRQEAIRRGMGSAGQVVLLIDGAAGLENMGKDCFKDCLQIVDFYHAMEHAGSGAGGPDRQRPSGLQKTAAPLGQAAAQRQGAGLDRRDAPRMRRPAPSSGGGESTWATLCATSAGCSMAPSEPQGYFIGSGVVEAGCKTRHRRPLQTIGHVLVGVRRRKHPRPALHPQQPQIR